jgi:hypothetical protein
MYILSVFVFMTVQTMTFLKLVWSRASIAIAIAAKRLYSGQLVSLYSYYSKPAVAPLAHLARYPI